MIPSVSLHRTIKYLRNEIMVSEDITILHIISRRSHKFHTLEQILDNSKTNKNYIEDGITKMRNL